MERLNSRVEASGWIEITKTSIKDLLTQFCTISMEYFKNEATNYLAIDSNNKLVVNKRRKAAFMLALITSGDKFKLK